MALEMSTRGFESCYKVYHTGKGGCLEVVFYVAPLALISALLVSAIWGHLNSLASRAGPTANPFSLCFWGAVCGLLAFGAVQAVLKRRNLKLGICGDGLLLQNWFGRRRFVRWQDIVAVIWEIHYGKYDSNYRLVIEVAEGRDSTSGIRLAPWSLPLDFTPYVEAVELKDKIIELRKFTEVETHSRTEGVGKSRHEVEQGIWR